MKRRKTAGELHAKAISDSTKYKVDEVAEAACQDVLEHATECARRHHDVIDEPEFFVVMLMGNDSILSTVTRCKFYAWPFLPEPRPLQTVWHYRKSTQELKFLWALPDADGIAILSYMTDVKRRYKRMKRWCDWFFTGTFAAHVRQTWERSDWLTEKEFRDLHSAELAQAVADKHEALASDPTKLANIDTSEISHAMNAVTGKNRLDSRGEAKNPEGRILTN